MTLTQDQIDRAQALITASPAFPSHGSMGEVAHEGMTLRDYFAAEMLPIVPEMMSHNMKDRETHRDYMARRAYEYADAMLRARTTKE